MRINHSTRTLAGGAATLALCMGAFAWGLHASPAARPGHDLSEQAFSSGQPVAGPSILLTSKQSKPALIAAANIPTPPSDGIAVDDMNGDSPAATFRQIYDLLKRNYVEGVPDDSKLAHGAAAAMIASLQDPNSRFLEPTVFAEKQREDQGQFAGLGAALAVRTHIVPKTADDPTRDKDHPANVSYELTVVNPLPGSPAEHAGLQAGDVITDINGQWIATYDLVSADAKALKAAQDKNDPVALNKMIDVLQKKLDNALTLDQAEVKLSDPTVKTLTLTVARRGQPKTLTLTAEPAKLTAIAPVTSKSLSGGIGYVKINQFDADTADAFRGTLSALGADVKGIVLDLRGATGGSQEAAAAVASHLSTITVLGYQQAKGGKMTLLPLAPAKTVPGPVIVLVNSGTSGVAELVASALQSGGAKLIGTTTFGENSDVETIALRDGSGFTMTVGQWLTASKMSFGSVGIKPDVTVMDAPGSDNSLLRAEMEISGRVARVP